MAYRRRNGSDTWHFCTNCTEWPRSNYTEQQSRPSSGELCDQCKAKERAGTCR